jgi:hypothetical protein
MIQLPLGGRFLGGIRTLELITSVVKDFIWLERCQGGELGINGSNVGSNLSQTFIFEFELFEFILKVVKGVFQGRQFVFQSLGCGFPYEEIGKVK